MAGRWIIFPAQLVWMARVDEIEILSGVQL
jgi:hypothetical protein